MRYKIGRNPVYRAPIPALIGGINTAASSDIVGDNQLSNSLNMMAMDGILRTRPGFKINTLGFHDLQWFAKNIKKYDITVELNEKYGKLISVWLSGGTIKFYHCCSDGTIHFAGEIVPDTYEYNGEKKPLWEEIKNELTVASADGLYSFLTVNYEAGVGNDTYLIYKSSVTKDENDVEFLKWEEVTNTFVPTVMTNCRSDGIESSGILSGSFIQGYNLINNKYSIEITAYNDMRTEPYHKAIYKLPFQAFINTNVYIEYINKSGTKIKKSIEVNNTWCYAKDVGDTTSEGEGFNFALLDDHQTLVIYKTVEGTVETNTSEGTGPVVADVTNETDWVYKEIEEEGQGAVLAKLVVLPGLNNITVTAEYEPDLESKKRVFSATCAAWYGGNRGLASGTRLFIGGMEGVYKNVLQWSDISNPLYFPENCNSEVGDPSSAITGFGKQADSLYIFKPNEIHAANYVFNELDTDDSSLDLITDLTVTTAVFPLTQISSEIGCDCPGTIQLCRNRLCWAHSNGKVYTLVSSSQYNEKNIYELTDPIRQALPNVAPSLLKGATSTDWEGYYVLSVDEHIFLMQYESYGYSRIYSYTSEEAASHKLPWFYLKLPYAPRWVMNVENRLLTVTSIVHDNTEEAPNRVIVLHYADRDSVTDDILSSKYYIEPDEQRHLEITAKEIPSMVQSKIFDFSRPEIKKIICHILAEIGGTSGNSIKLSAVTDRSRYEDTVEGDGNSPINLDDEFTREGSSIITPLPETIERTVMRISANALVSVPVRRINALAPNFFRMIRVNPGIFGVRKFAVRLESEGAFSLGQVCIEYKMLGSVN